MGKQVQSSLKSESEIKNLLNIIFELFDKNKIYNNYSFYAIIKGFFDYFIEGKKGIKNKE